ncbi:endonuclease/exonuclease/phosphatase family protein [Candidatus Thorarchaeota archaeon]|nr:MAG: endonuclease/exonuclease/phosphatase family protein [Candidatus Thorarchaeota archaeon]
MNTKKIVILIGVMALVASSSVLVFLYLSSMSPPDESNQPPVLEITNPTPGSTVSGTVTINVTVIDEEDLTATIFIDGTNTTMSNLYAWDTTAYPDGKHTIRVEAYDSMDWYDRESFQVLVDNVDELRPPYDGLFKTMVYNIKESGRNYDWITMVKQENPDVLVVVETGFWDDDANEEMNAAVSQLNAYFEDEMPYEAYCAQNVEYSTTGEAILSRFPILDFNQIEKVPMDDGSEYYVTHDFIEAVLDINGTEVHVFGGHLKASDGETNMWRREQEQEGIINYMDALGEVPILYMSDQNSFSPADTGQLAPEGMELGFGPMTMMLYPNDTIYGNRSSVVHNFTDVYRTLNPSVPGHTYGHQDGAVSYRIDYILVNSFFSDGLLNSSVVDEEPADTASDHYAVSAFIEWNSVSTVPALLAEPSGKEDQRDTAPNNIVRNRVLLPGMCACSVDYLYVGITAEPKEYPET